MLRASGFDAPRERDSYHNKVDKVPARLNPDKTNKKTGPVPAFDGVVTWFGHPLALVPL